MAAGDASDIVGFCVLNRGKTAGLTQLGQAYLPLLRGSRVLRSPALDRVDEAEGFPESPLWSQGVTMPALYVRTPLFGGDPNAGGWKGGWFTANRLNTMLIPDNTLFAGNSQPWGINAGVPSGLLKGVNLLGPVQHRFANDGALEWPDAKVANFRVDWSEQDPIVATFTLLLKGAPVDASSLTPVTDATTPPAGASFMSQGMTYGLTPTLNAVVSGSLSVNTNMRPDVTTPLATPLSTAAGAVGVGYPNDYFNEGPPDVMLDLVQKKGATTVVSPSDEGTGTITLEFNALTAGKVTCFLAVQKPDADYTTNLTLARIRRSYQNIKPNAKRSETGFPAPGAGDYSIYFQ